MIGISPASLKTQNLNSLLFPYFPFLDHWLKVFFTSRKARNGNQSFWNQAENPAKRGRARWCPAARLWAVHTELVPLESTLPAYSRNDAPSAPFPSCTFTSIIQTNHKYHSILRQNRERRGGGMKLKLGCTRRVLQNSLAQLSLSGMCQQKGLESTGAMAKLLICSTAQISAEMQHWQTSQQSCYLSFQVWQPGKPVFSF